MWLEFRGAKMKTNWDEKAKNDAVQSGKGPGEFGPDYSDRKAFHLDYHADWEHPTHDTMGKPLLKRTPYPSPVSYTHLTLPTTPYV